MTNCLPGPGVGRPRPAPGGGGGPAPGPSPRSTSGRSRGRGTSPGGCTGWSSPRATRTCSGRGATTPWGLWKSRDGGATWEKVRACGLARDSWAIDAGPDGTLYVGDHFGRGVRVSSDGGATFVDAEGLPSGYVAAIAADPSRPGVAFAALGLESNADGEGDHGPPLNREGWLVRTDDGGRTWRPIEGLPTGGPWTAVFVHPGDPAVLLAARSRETWRSADRGATWTEVPGVAYVYRLAGAPAARSGRAASGRCSAPPTGGRASFRGATCRAPAAACG